MSLHSILVEMFGGQEMKYLFALVAANFIFGVVAALKARDFRLTKLADWLFTRMIPMVAGYGVTAMLAYVNPELLPLKVAAYATVSMSLLGYVLASLKDIGIKLPKSLAGR